MTRVVMLHGAAATPRVYRRVVSALAHLLPDAEVAVPQRASSGDWGREIADLTPVCEGQYVVGVSGGATLALGLALAGVATSGTLAHEPAVGRLAPGLLRPVADALRTGGPVAFGQTLYGERWTSDELPEDVTSVDRDLVMFSRFEVPLGADLRSITVSVGVASPPARHAAAQALHEATGVRLLRAQGTSHAWMLEDPAGMARVIADLWGANWHDGPTIANDVLESSCPVPSSPAVEHP